MSNIELYLFDMDGTIYVGNSLIDGAKEKIEEIRQKKRICFLTNNSSRSQADYVEKLARLGINVDMDEIYTSGNSATRFLNKFHKNRRVYLLGTEKLRHQFLQAGINLVEESPDIVMVGYDTQLTYQKLCKAVTFLAQGALYFCTHSDINCPATPVYVPDVGSFMALIERSINRVPQVICGKPFTPMGDAIADKFHLSCDQIAMVGDRLCTDMQFAVNNHFTSYLVLTGETTLDDYKKSNMQLDHVIDSLVDIEL